MSSDNMILIVPASVRTTDEDVARLHPLIQKVVKIAEEKIFADFEIMRDMPHINDAICQPGQNCEHVFTVRLSSSGRVMDIYNEAIHPTCIIKCSNCGIEYDLCKNQFEVSNYFQDKFEKNTDNV